MMKYILVTGGVISGIGKGIVSSSLGTLLKACGLRVTSIKIDPYINIDAGTFSPYEHGEVYVLDDGGEVDLDLGNYERFLDVTLHSDNNITTGKIYQHVIKKERQGDYLGKTVQVVPHITSAIQEWVERVAHIPSDNTKLTPEVCIVELGGTVGDIESMPFIEAFRQFQFRVGKSNFACVHVSLIPSPKTTGEQKTKPTQMSVRELRGLGLSPDLLFCRSNHKLLAGVREKLSMFCHVSPNCVVSVPDVDSLYRVPLLLEEEKVHELLLHHFTMDMKKTNPRRLLSHWRRLSDRHDNCTQQVRIVLVGKYVQLEDSYISMTKALQHAAIFANLSLQLEYVSAEELEESHQEIDPIAYHRSWERLCSAQGVLVAGGFGIRGVEGKILAIGWCRKNKVPCLGVCLGMQCAVIEFARNELGWTDANSTEFAPETRHPVILDMPEFNPDEKGGTMRLGRRNTLFRVQNSLMRTMYGNLDSIEERHRHRFEVNPNMVPDLEQRGLRFTGQSEDGQRMEIVELSDHPYFVGVQYHPEFLSRPLRPSPPYLGLILSASGMLKSYLRRGCRIKHSFLRGLDEEDDSDEELPMTLLNNPQHSHLTASGARSADTDTSRTDSPLGSDASEKHGTGDP